MTQQYKYFAFISYSSKDTAWGKRVQHKLEHYRMPATLCSERGWQRTPIKPVFFAPTDIQPGGLTEELQERLRASRHLIVICSPHSAQSEWVGREIEFFHQLGRTKQIHFFIVDGTPHSGNPQTECFNPIVGRLGLPEILGANIHERIYRWPWLNKERAYVQLISKLLGVEFDAIWQRHRRQLIRRTIAWALGLISVVATLIGVWVQNQPKDIRVRLSEVTPANMALPPLRDAVVTLHLDNETKTDTIAALNLPTRFRNIPHRFLHTPVRITADCPDHLAIDTTLTLTEEVVLAIRRDPQVYGNVHFRLWNPATEAPQPGIEVSIEGHRAVSDAQGRIALTIPLSAQRQAYHVTAAVPLVTDTLYMPCGTDDVLLTE